jgi:hypothetical protein
MWQEPVTFKTLAAAVKETLTSCEAALADAQERKKWPSIRDLDEAVQALRLIHKELTTGQRRPVGIRSARFCRYILDFEPFVVMEEQMKNRVMRIEEVYSQMSR